jgi:PfaD family protein
VGCWSGRAEKLVTRPEDLADGLANVGRPLYVLDKGGAFAIATEGSVRFESPGEGELPLLGAAHPCRPEHLGSVDFARDHGLDYCYVAGAMAGGIGSVAIVEALAGAGMLGFYGAAGLAPTIVEDAVDRLSTNLADRPWGCNLIHSPYEPRLEEQVSDLYVRRGVRLASASAYLGLTLPLLRYRLAGIRADASGRVETPNRVVAKVSRVEVAEKFLSPPPAKMLAALVASGDLSEEQANMAATIPVAQDLTVEADSGGHTDNRPALSLLPTMLSLRDRMQELHGYELPLRVGAAGGIATPQSVAAAFSMGADFVVTGSVNQATMEAGTSDTVRQMLAAAQQADVTMAPAADMFEMGVKLQVLKRGTMFAMRAQKLYDLYRAHTGLDALPAKEREALEKAVFRMPLSEVRKQTDAFWLERDPAQVERANRDPKHQMALCFRWYLGLSSRWANTGEPGREVDYQVWCGPSMGAFNEWARGSYLQDWENRRVVPIARNLLHGAAVISRANALREQGVSLPPEAVDVRPREADVLEELMA